MPGGGKYFCFTLNSNSEKGEHINWPSTKVCPVLDWWERRLDNGLTYLVCQVEKAPSTGKYHLQGYIALDKRTMLTMLKRLFSATAHWEVARGKPAENRTYCTKAETHVNGPWEFGELPEGQGSRSDLKTLMADVQADKTNCDMLISSEGKSAKFAKHIDYMRFCLNRKKSDRQLTGVKVIVLYGPTGVGKTYSAVNYFGAADSAGVANYHLQECPSTKDAKLWLDGYEGQRVLILDDFSGDFCNYR